MVIGGFRRSRYHFDMRLYIDQGKKLADGATEKTKNLYIIHRRNSICYVAESYCRLRADEGCWNKILLFLDCNNISLGLLYNNISFFKACTICSYDSIII